MTNLTPITPESVGTAIVSTVTAIAPLTDANGTSYAVSVRNGQGGTEFPLNAASWTHNSDGSLDIFDSGALLVASYPEGMWWNAQLVYAPEPAVPPPSAQGLNQ